MLVFWGTVPPIVSPNVLNNKTKCLHFLNFRYHNSSFLIDFGVIFPPGGTPGASRAPLGAQVVSQVDFLMVFSRPGGGFGAPFGLFGFPWDDLGPHFGAQSGHKRGKKSVSSAHRVPEAILGAKRKGPGPS